MPSTSDSTFSMLGMSAREERSLRRYSGIVGAVERARVLQDEDDEIDGDEQQEKGPEERADEEEEEEEEEEQAEEVYGRDRREADDAG